MQGLNGSDTVFMFVSTILVMLMTPGLALYYGGMVRGKNVLSTTMHSYSALAIISVQWILFGYSLAFGTDWHGLIGGFNFVGLNGVGFNPNADYSATIPHGLFMLFQLMFAIITPALISGAFAERMKFGPFVAFTFLWATFVYDPLAHWVWGAGGWLHNLGALDFAGGTVVHISSGVSGLVLAILLGKRKELNTIAPHNLPTTVLGAAILWFGWFGFNVGSALTFNNVALTAFINTNTAAAVAAIAWVACEWSLTKKPTILGTVSGVIAGLVAITPACGYVTPMASIVIGLVGGVVCYFGVSYLKKKLGYDDALDSFGVHGIGGTWGGIATGLFATKTVNDAGANGLFYGDPSLVVKQLIAIVTSYALAAIGTLIIIKVIGLFTAIRTTEEEEALGLDISIHGEKAYHESL
ncbi:ammonium transporter [Ectobacillus polymachus]|uniref:ammonium transporter n=1 Tax=Ectobacillus polymachus TaxID=1508806 RepID=UPI003A86C250